MPCAMRCWANGSKQGHIPPCSSMCLSAASRWATKKTSERKQVFEKELPLALEAIRYGDQHFFRHFPSCDFSPIFVHFTSEYPELNRTHPYGIPYMYR
ncbi:staygreen family protein [Geobacillus proteiniphilus]|uniref:Staygreen family protein n=1 Tax=Geobacillus proteiniphilus TaxID=860353 RepID=A0ABY9MK04_9BACL|nr:staygreen family protein [Geobacillus proteiniphilus]WMJ18206.1 staygreen family protein [Geobacillus proteiniphilus]